MNEQKDLDFLIRKDGQTFAGIHLLIDFYQASNLTDKNLIEEALESAASAVNAKKIDICVHKFSQNHGVSGVITLAESHISIHTWPEIFFAAIDVFTCGKCKPHSSIDILKNYLEPSRIEIVERYRGLIA